MGSGILGTNVLAGHGFFGFDPTPNASLSRSGVSVNSSGGMPTIALNTAPDGNAKLTSVVKAPANTGNANPQVLGANTQTPSNSVYSNGGGGGGGSAAGSADWQDQQNALLGIDQGLSSANDALGRLDSQASVGHGNVEREAQAAYQALLGNKQIAQRDYNTGRTNQVNEYESKRATNSTNARNWLDGALRTLGTQGAGGGSAARYGLPYQAQTQASQANATDQSTNNRNLISLDTNWNDTQDKFKNAQSDIDRQKQQGMNDFDSKIANQRATILQTIAQLTGQKAIANGGDYRSAMAASQGIASQIPGLLNQINDLSATPSITPQAVSVNAPTLDGYNYARPDAPVLPQQDPTLSGNPVLAGILGYDPNQEQQQNPYQFAYS